MSIVALTSVLLHFVAALELAASVFPTCAALLLWVNGCRCSQTWAGEMFTPRLSVLV